MEGSGDPYHLGTYVSTQHTYAESGSYSVTIGAEYHDDSESSNPTYTYETTLVKNVIVSDATPTVSVRGDTTATVVGDHYTLLPTFTDTGSGDVPRQWTVAWGDGTSNAYFGDLGSFTHVYATANATSGTVYSPSATVVSDDGTYSASTSVTIGQPIMNVIQGDGTPMNHDDQHDMGAFIPINSDDDLGNYDSNGNPIPDLNYTTPQSYADPDLMEVTLQPVPAAVGGTYSLSWNGNDMRVWTDAYKTTQLFSGATFSATTGHAVYLEGIGAPQATDDVLEEDWQGGPGNALLVKNADTAKVKKLVVYGPQNVPAYGIYKYSVGGPAPYGVTSDSWSVTNGSISGTSPSPTRTSIQWTKANAGTAGWVGDINFVVPEKLGNFETTPRQIFVVNVAVTTPANTFVAGPITDQTKKGAAGKDIEAGVPRGQPGMAWAANVTLNGPNNNAGITRIKVGFIQNIVQFTDDGEYADNTVLKSSLDLGAGGTPYFDEEPHGVTVRPWYSGLNGFFNNVHFQSLFKPTNANDNAKTLNQDDSPDGGPFIINRATGALLVKMSLYFGFNLYVCAQTQDVENGANRSYVEEASAAWSFNGDGKIVQPNFAYQPTDAKISAPPNKAWTWPVTSGAIPVITGQDFNTKAKTMRFK